MKSKSVYELFYDVGYGHGTAWRTGQVYDFRQGAVEGRAAAREQGTELDVFETDLNPDCSRGYREGYQAGAAESNKPGSLPAGARPDTSKEF